MKLNVFVKALVLGILCLVTLQVKHIERNAKVAEADILLAMLY